MKRFYEASGHNGLNTLRLVVDAEESTDNTLTIDLSMRIKELLDLNMGLSEFTNSEFYFLDGTAYRIDGKGVKADAAPLDADQMAQTVLMLQHGLNGLTLAETITKLSELPDSQRLKTVADIFGVGDLLAQVTKEHTAAEVRAAAKAARDKAAAAKSGKTTDTNTDGLPLPTLKQVQTVFDFVKAHAVEEYKAPAVWSMALSDVKGEECKTSHSKPTTAAYMTAHVAIVGFKLGVKGATWAKVAERLEAIEALGLPQFTERLTVAAKAASSLEDLTVTV